MKPIIEKSSNPRYKEYDQYLSEHIGGVVRAWKEQLRPFIKKNQSMYDISDEDIRQVDLLIEYHDSSKYEPEEYNPYCDYFYPSAGHEKDDDAFDLAWLLHQKKNPHHWQYWVLIRDSGKQEALDMAPAAVCEMLCDWQSFSLKDSKSTAYAWWEAHKDEMILSSATKKLVNQLVKGLKNPLKRIV